MAPAVRLQRCVAGTAAATQLLHRCCTAGAAGAAAAAALRLLPRVPPNPVSLPLALPLALPPLPQGWATCWAWTRTTWAATCPATQASQPARLTASSRPAGMQCSSCLRRPPQPLPLTPLSSLLRDMACMKRKQGTRLLTDGGLRWGEQRRNRGTLPRRRQAPACTSRGLTPHHCPAEPPAPAERPEAAGLNRLRTARVLEEGMAITVEPGEHLNVWLHGLGDGQSWRERGGYGVQACNAREGGSAFP